MKKYPEVFETYWQRARFHVRGLLYYGPHITELQKEQTEQIRRIAFRCWKAGRKYEKNAAYGRMITNG